MLLICYLAVFIIFSFLNKILVYFNPIFFRVKYTEIWDLDEKDPFMRPEGGESVADVASRLTSALVQIESEFQG